MFSIIVAHDSNRGIGKDGKLPWPHNKNDMKRFVDITTTAPEGKTNAVIMGRKTWESLPNPLINRINIVLKRDGYVPTRYDPNGTEIENVYTFNNLDAALYALSNDASVGNIFVIGGQEIYELAIRDPRCTHIYLTKFNKDYGPCDKFFPPIPEWFDEVSTMHASLLLEYKTYTTRYDLTSSEYNYLNLLGNILTYGDEITEERTKTGTLSLDGGFLSFPISTMNPNADINQLEYRVPVLTTKTLFIRGIFEELIMFLNGETNVRELQKKKVGIWNGNTSREWLDSHNLQHYEVGETGPFYGFQWNFFGADYLGANSRDAHGKDLKGINQLEQCIKLLKTDPYSRRIVLTAWNPIDLPNMVLPPCHCMYVFKVRPPMPGSNGKQVLCCTMLQRSGDMFLGIPFNIMSMTFLTIFMSRAAGMLPGTIHIAISDAHIYKNHIEQVKEQLKRIPYRFPTIKINAKINTLADMRGLTYDKIEIMNYHKWPEIKGEMAI